MDYAFSDGSPAYELAAAVVVFLLCAVIARRPAARRALDGGVGQFASWLRGRGLFTLDDPWVEQRRLDLLRVVLGALACWSVQRDVASALGTNDSTLLAAQGTALALTAMILVGFLTPIACVTYGALINLYIGNVSGSANLGSMVITMTLVVFAFAPAGRSLSLDAWLMRRRSWPVGRAIRCLYDAWGALTPDRAAVVKAVALLVYATITLYAALTHLAEPSWTSGLLNAWLLLSRLTNPSYFRAVEWFYAESPFLYVNLARLTTYGTLAWELLLLPLVLLHRWTRAFVVVWGVGFFLVAALVLPLRLLGWFECILWATLFWNRWRLNPHGRDTVHVSYGARHAAAVRALRMVDLFGVIDAAPYEGGAAHEPDAAHASKAGISASAGGRGARHGIAAYGLIASRVLLLLPLWPTLAVAGAAAGLLRPDERRAAPAGAPAARAGTPRRASPWGGRPAPTGNPVVFHAFLLSAALLLVAFIVRLPYVKDVPGFYFAAGWSRLLLGQAPLVYGIGPVDVFNALQAHQRRSSIFAWWGDGQTRFLDLQAALGVLSTSDIYGLTRHIVHISATAEPCGNDQMTAFLADLGNRYAPHAVQGRPHGPLTLFVTFFYDEWPDEEDLRAYRHVQVRNLVVCDMQIDLTRRAVNWREYFPDAPRIYARRHKLPFEPGVQGMTHLERFPCREDAMRIVTWFDNVTFPGAARANDAVSALVNDLGSKSSLVCFPQAIAVTELVDLDWRPDNPPPPDDIPCVVDLALAVAYEAALAGTTFAGRAAEAVRLARAADEREDRVGCLLAAADARRAFIDIVRADAPARGAAPEGPAARAAPHR